MRNIVKLAILTFGMLCSLAVAGPARAGSWAVTYSVDGFRTTASPPQAGGAATEQTSAWPAEGDVDFNGPPGSAAASAAKGPSPNGSAEVDGSVTPILTWLPTDADDLPATIINYVATTKVFTMTSAVKPGFDHGAVTMELNDGFDDPLVQATGEYMYNASMEGVHYDTRNNRERSAVIHLPSRHLHATISCSSDQLQNKNEDGTYIGWSYEVYAQFSVDAASPCEPKGPTPQ